MPACGREAYLFATQTGFRSREVCNWYSWLLHSEALKRFTNSRFSGFVLASKNVCLCSFPVSGLQWTQWSLLHILRMRAFRKSYFFQPCSTVIHLPAITVVKFLGSLSSWKSLWSCQVSTKRVDSSSLPHQPSNNLKEHWLWKTRAGWPQGTISPELRNWVFRMSQY